MAFGPESTNPRERRAYAHTIIAKLAVGEANYGEAAQAAWRASHTTKGEASGFEGALESAKDNLVRREQGSSAHRAIRKVPLNWQHPRDENGGYIPLYDTREPAGGVYTFSELDWMVEEGDITPDEDMKAWFMPTFHDVPEEEMGVCLYETTTEGTPVTPVFPDTDEGRRDLAAYAGEYATVFSDHLASSQVWHERLFGGTETIAQ